MSLKRLNASYIKPTIRECSCDKFDLVVCPVRIVDFESFDLETSISGVWVRFRNIQDKFVYQGRRVKGQGHAIKNGINGCK